MRLAAGRNRGDPLDRAGAALGVPAHHGDGEPARRQPHRGLQTDPPGPRRHDCSLLHGPALRRLAIRNRIAIRSNKGTLAQPDTYPV
ncbi:hypothetical protein GCM10009577_25280 [Streptomyces javensis]